ncbi:zinc ribbon domain-containing protein [Staphylococcus simulans]|uniref:zinc ribbon domain-containing protein n=1 Tax=Staphylococcus simulans TaxID=1286 RepID=UPI001E58064A|nr:zinc ribbon domain-containing protein [Staphylococcus simulans]MCD8915463.1 zinc ribbon domain-containing protein [Staphylococcus simulans]
MKFCPNCGEKLNDNQVFCNNCGTKVGNKPIGQPTKQHINRQVKNSSHSKSKIPMIIISAIIVIILIASICFAFYYLKNNNDHSNQGGNHANKVDVLSTDFSRNFMNQENTGGYKGFNLGMTPNEIENRFGKEDKTITLDIGDVHQYGNMGVYFGSNDTVSSVYVIPNNVTVDEFKDFHGEPTVQSDEQMIYDDNPDNDFSIFISHNNGKIISIENTFQIDQLSLNNFESISENSKDDVDSTFSLDAINYANGISKTLDTAFNGEDYTDLPDSLSDARTMTDSWDDLLSSLKSQASTTEENHIVDQLNIFKDDREAIFENLQSFIDDHNSQAWQDAQKQEVQLKEELKYFGDQLSE